MSLVCVCVIIVIINEQCYNTHNNGISDITMVIRNHKCVCVCVYYLTVILCVCVCIISQLSHSYIIVCVTMMK